jgi:DNA polymerase III subunit epsilon
MVSPVPLPPFGVVDLETSGLSTRRHRVLQIGLVMVTADGTVTDEWSTLVKLRWPLQRVGPSHIHGITRADLRAAPTLDQALDDLGARLRGSIFTAHNAAFDAAFLARARRRRPPSDALRQSLSPLLCTLRMSRKLDPLREQSHRLADVCARYDVALERPHDALGDAEATAAVLPRLLDAHGITDVSQLEPFYVSL